MSVYPARVNRTAISSPADPLVLTYDVRQGSQQFLNPDSEQIFRFNLHALGFTSCQQTPDGPFKHLTPSGKPPVFSEHHVAFTAPRAARTGLISDFKDDSAFAFYVWFRVPALPAGISYLCGNSDGTLAGGGVNMFFQPPNWHAQSMTGTGATQSNIIFTTPPSWATAPAEAKVMGIMFAQDATKRRLYPWGAAGFEDTVLTPFPSQAGGRGISPGAPFVATLSCIEAELLTVEFSRYVPVLKADADQRMTNMAANILRRGYDVAA